MVIFHCYVSSPEGTAQCDLKETAGTRSSPSPRYRRQRFSPTHATRYRRCHRRKMPQAHRAPPGTMVSHGNWAIWAVWAV